MEERKVTFTTMPYCKPGMFDQSDEEYREYCKKRSGVLVNTSEETALNSVGESVIISVAHVIEDGTNKSISIPLENVEFIE